MCMCMHMCMHMCSGAQSAPSLGAQVRTTLEGKVSNLVEYPGYAVVVCMCLSVALDQVEG